MAREYGKSVSAIRIASAYKVSSDGRSYYTVLSSKMNVCSLTGF
jgi:hypothetical protein